MNKLQQRVQQRGQGGFTLVELLVVIAILAILAGVVVFAVGNSTDNAKVSACQAESRALSTAANATKAATLTEATPTVATINAALDGFIDGPTLGGDYFTAAYNTATDDITFTAVGTTPTGCTGPATVSNILP